MLNDAVLHHRHFVAQGHRFDLVVGHVDGGGFQTLVHQLHFGTHLDPQLGVEVGQRFVEQVDLRPARQGTAHGHALLLATGQLARLAVEQVFDLQQLGHARHFGVDVGLRHLADLEAELDVLAHAHGRVQRVGLEHHGDVTVLGAHAAHVLITDHDRAAGDGLKAGDAVHQRGFTAARRADQDQELAFLDRQFDVLQGVGQAGAIGLVYIAKFKRSHDYPLTAPAVRPRTKYLPAIT